MSKQQSRIYPERTMPAPDPLDYDSWDSALDHDARFIDNADMQERMLGEFSISPASY